MNFTMTDEIVAKKYAQAFINLYGSTMSLEMISQFVRAESFVQANRSVLLLLSLAYIDHEQRLHMIQEFVSHFSLPSACVQLLVVIVSHNRSSLLSLVLWYIVQIYKKQINSIEFAITSSHELDSNSLDQIKHFLERRTGKHIIYSYAVDKGLIAGIRLLSNEYVWEYSVRKHINAIACSINR